MDPSRRQPLGTSQVPNVPPSSSTPKTQPGKQTVPAQSSTVPLRSNGPATSQKPSGPSVSTTKPTPVQPNAPIEPVVLDPTTAAQVKQSDEVYEKVLRHMDWDGKRPPAAPKPFKPFYFLQPASAQQYQSPGLAAPENARYWASNGSLASAKTVMIASETQRSSLKEWAKKQGKNGRLCPDVFMVGDKKVVGETLIV